MIAIDSVLSGVGWPHLVIALVSGLLCALLILLAPFIPRLTGSPSLLRAIQACHMRPTPRVGGIAIFAALAVGLLFAPFDLSFSYTTFILVTGLLFAVGLVEDLGFGVSPMKRLFAAMFTSLLVIILVDISLPRIGISGLDWIMNYWIIAAPITILVTAAITNAFNLIDGVNGLAALAAIVAAVSMAAISAQAGYDDMVTLTLLLAACVVGFAVFNFPLGKIFLGDAGAYTLGFVLSWFAIIILIKVPQATPWALLLTLFWPVADMCLAIYRRQWKRMDKTSPDRLHVHQLVMRALESHLLGRGKRRIANPLSTVVLAPFIATPALFGVMFWDQPHAAFLAVVILGILFSVAYILAFPLLRALARKSACGNQTNTGLRTRSNRRLKA